MIASSARRPHGFTAVFGLLFLSFVVFCPGKLVAADGNFDLERLRFRPPKAVFDWLREVPIVGSLPEAVRLKMSSSQLLTSQKTIAALSGSPEQWPAYVRLASQATMSPVYDSQTEHYPIRCFENVESDRHGLAQGISFRPKQSPKFRVYENEEKLFLKIDRSRGVIVHALCRVEKPRTHQVEKRVILQPIAYSLASAASPHQHAATSDSAGRRMSLHELQKKLFPETLKPWSNLTVMDWLHRDGEMKTSDVYRNPMGKLYVQLQPVSSVSNEGESEQDEKPPFDFEDGFLHNIYYGHFDRLESYLGEKDYRTQSNPLAVLFGKAMLRNPDLPIVILLYVDLADQRYGADQPGGTTSVDLVTSVVTMLGAIQKDKVETGRRRLHIDRRLIDLYREHLNGKSSVLSQALGMQSGRSLVSAREIQQDLERFFDTYKRGSAEHELLIDNLIRFDSERPVSVQQQRASKYKSSQLASRDEPLFTEALYAKYFRSLRYDTGFAPPIDGSLVGERFSDKGLSVDDVQLIALKRLLERIDAEGLKETDVNRAILEGRFRPDPRDVQMAIYGLADQQPTEKGSQFEYAIKRLGLIQPFSTPQSFGGSVKGLEWDVLYKMWDERFGSLESCFGTKTIVGNQVITLSPNSVKDAFPNSWIKSATAR